jgi:hypothetical protein
MSVSKGIVLRPPDSRDRSAYVADCDVIRCYGGAMIHDKHLAATVHCVDDEIIGDRAAWIEPFLTIDIACVTFALNRRSLPRQSKFI